MRLLIISLLFVLFSTATIVEASANASLLDPPHKEQPQPRQKSKYPTVFLIDDNSSNAFEDLTMQYETNLIQAFSNDMDKAYLQWMDMMCEMENFAERKRLDINGVKIWMKVFWSASGEIEHIAYHLKPNSKNISTELLTRFFRDFSKLHEFEVKAEKVFSHYTSVSFPNYFCKSKE